MSDDYLVDDERIEGLDPSDEYEQRILNKAMADFSNAEKFLRSYHTLCGEAYCAYHNSRDYENLRKDNKFPSPLIQQHVDDFVANLMDKIWYNNRPCTVVGREETDQKDADAKQEMMDYQDYRDDLYGKSSVFLRDAALYRIAIAKVDYDEKIERRLEGREVPVPILHPDTQQPMLAPNGDFVYERDTEGRVVTESVVEPVENVTYRGSKVKRIDPVNFFFTQDRTSDNDKPLMTRDYLCLADLESKPYYINIERLKSELTLAEMKGEAGSGTEPDQYAQVKRSARNYNPDMAASSDNFEYIEWQGLLDTRELYQYLGKSEEEIDFIAEVRPRTWAIVGVINRRVVVRLDEMPFEFDGPNIVIGMIQSDENEPTGVSIVDKMYSMHKGTEDMLGMLFENLKQSVNAMWVINTNALSGSGGEAVVNRAGQILETTGSPRDVAMRIEQPQVSKDIYSVIAMMSEWGKDSTGNKDTISGSGDPEAETLGEVQIVTNQASLKLLNYLRSFEKFITALYSMRNQINMQFIDTEYAIMVIGQNGMEWRTIDPRQIRANVDFVCEASSRETNRAVVTQQILQLIEMCVPLYQAGMGLPIRFDKLIKRLCEQGFTWTQDNIEEYFPSLKLEKMGLDIDGMMIQNWLVGLQAGQMNAAMGAMAPLLQPPGGGGGETPKPRSENEAIESANARNQTQVGRE